MKSKQFPYNGTMTLSLECKGLLLTYFSWFLWQSLFQFLYSVYGSKLTHKSDVYKFISNLYFIQKVFMDLLLYFNEEMEKRHLPHTKYLQVIKLISRIKYHI